MALGSIVIDLLMKTGSFETDSKKAERRLKELEKSAKAAGKVLGTAIVAGATAAAVAIKGSINAMDDMSKAALRAQMPTEDFSQLAYAGDLADVALQDLTNSMGKLAKAQGDAQRGLKTQVESFDQLGISFANADGSLRNTKEVFLDFADAFQTHQGSPEVMAAGMNVFGRSFQKLIPLLKDGRDGLEAAAAEADRLGITLSAESGRQAEEFNDNLTRLKTAALGLSQSVANELLPDLLALTEQLLGTATEGDKLRETATGIADAFRALGSVVDVAVRGFKVISGTVRGVMFDIIALTNAAHAGWDAITGDWNGAAQNMREAQIAREMAAGASDDVAAAFRGPGPASAFSGVRSRSTSSANQPAAVSLPPIRSAASKASKELTEAQKAAEKLADTYASMNERLGEQITLFGVTGEAAKVRYEIEHGALKGLEPLRQKALIEQAEWLDWMNEMADVEAVWADSSADATAQMIESWSAVSDEMSVYAEQAARNMQDAFADFLFDPFDGGLKGMLNSFADILKRMAAEAAAAKIFESLGNYGQANSGTWWGSLLSAFGGAQGKAGGGHITGAGTAKSDSIPAWLSNGEYVIQADAVAKYGKSFLDGLNAKRYASGGYVGAPVPGSGVGAGVNVNIYNAPGGADVQQRQNASGGMDIDVIFKQIEQNIAGNMSMGASPINSALQGRYNLRPAV